jgi:TetR/AcrR family transcriptional regulator, transcriptional repressor for nem operon
MAKTTARAGEASALILDVAEKLVQTRGYNGFSYADVAEQLAVTKASLHYHFATKADLGHALIVRYREGFLNALGAIDRDVTAPIDKLTSYADLYKAVLKEGRMCLCGMVAAEYATLPKAMQDEIRRFFAANETWLSAVVEEGARAGVLRPNGAPVDTARLIVSALEGAMLVARVHRNVEWFDATARRVLAELAVAQPAKKQIARARR